MAQDSKAKRKERRVRRQSTLRRLMPVLARNFQLETQARQAETFVNEANKSAAVARILLMAVIGQHGGSVEVTRGTLAQVQENAHNLGWTVRDKDGDPQTVIVTVVQGVKTEDVPSDAEVVESVDTGVESTQTPVIVSDQATKDYYDAVVDAEDNARHAG